MSISAMTKALEALESIKVTVSTATEANVIDGIDLFPREIAELRIGIADAEQRAQMRNAESREWVGQPDLARVGEVGVWGKEKNSE